MIKVLCLKCGSDQLTADKKGFSGKKAFAGAILTGCIGLLAGTIGSNKVKITCLICGHEFKPGEGAKSESDFKKNRKLDKQVALGRLVIVGILAIFGLFEKMCSSDPKTNVLKTSKENTSTIIDNKSTTDIIGENDFIIGKIGLYENIYLNDAQKSHFKQDNENYTKNFLAKTNGKIENWYATVDGITLSSKPSDITLLKKGMTPNEVFKIDPIGRSVDFLFKKNTKITNMTIPYVMLFLPDKTYQIKPKTDLFDKISKVSEGDLVIITAEVIKTEEYTTSEENGTIFTIKLIDIK